MPFDLAPLAAGWLVLVCLGAAFIRGYSGFGFAAILVLGGSLVTDPLNLIALVILADIVMTAGQLPGIARHIDWGRVLPMALGAVVAIPFSVPFVAGIGPDTARAVIALFVLAMCAILLAGWQITRRPGAAAHAGVGIVSGLAQGGAAGGLPVAAFFAAQPIEAARFRATIIAYFCVMDLWTLPNIWWAGMVGAKELWATALLLPVMFLGLWLGGRRFLSASPQGFRRFAILLLSALSIAALARSVM